MCNQDFHTTMSMFYFAVKMATAGADFLHKITRGIPLSTPRKGHEKKSYEQLQAEALEKKERERAVLRMNNGAWPGELAPSHSLFLWAGGSELTTILEKYHKYMPDKFIPYRLRLVKASPMPILYAVIRFTNHDLVHI